MRALGLSALAGILAALALEQLPWTPGVALLLAGACLALRCPALRLPAAFLFGFAWGAQAALTALNARVPPDMEGEVVRLAGRVAEFPQERAGTRAFVLDRVRARSSVPAAPALPPRLLIQADALGATPAPGDWCELAVRLQAARGFANPGGRDREREYLARHLGGRGRVLRHPANLCVAIGNAGGPAGLRTTISNAIVEGVPEAATGAVLRALTVDDRSGLSEAQWAVMRDTGTSHLLSISGLHVSIVAVGAFFVCRWLAAVFGARRQGYPAIRVGWYGAVLAALCYAALAGFGIPVARAALMVGAAATAGLMQRRVLGYDTWLVALGLLVVVDPLSLLGTGTWLSFGAVAVLIALAHGGQHGLSGTLRTHVVLTVALAPLTACLFGQFSFSAPLANLLAVPLTSVLVVPLALAGVACLPWHDELAVLLWDMAGRLWEWLWIFLVHLAEWAPALDVAAQFDRVTSGCVTLGLVLVAVPPAARLRPLGLLLLASLALPHAMPLAAGEFRLHLLDVGQGLAVLVQTRHSATLYDAGPRWHGTGRDAGADVVLPALAALGVRRLDLLVVSHADIDHAGGARSVLAALPVSGVRWSQPIAGVPPDLARPCEAPGRWRHDGVSFAFLHPQGGDSGSRNARSCVLLISSPYGRVLLSGDIEASTESLLVQRYGADLAADVLVVPHHGSATSSTAALLARVRPRLALIGAGYRNRYGFPHADVVARYQALPSALMNTAEFGAIRLDVGGDGLAIQAWRGSGPGFWRRRPPLPAVALSGGARVW